MESIVKRDGRIAVFDETKISTAIWKAMRAVGEPDEAAAQRMAHRITALLDGRFVVESPTVEEVQDLVEECLIREGWTQAAKVYILYRKKHEELRRLRGKLTELPLVEDYLHDRDWRIRENSNMTFSLQGLNSHITDKIISQYWLGRIYDDNVREAHESGDLHIHDLGTLGAYCVGWDLRELLLRGFRGVRGKIESKPAKHFRVALLQVVNFLYTLQGESAGAQALSNVDTYLAPFIRADGLAYAEIKQNVQEFVYNMNVPTRVGFQTPFTNVTMDLRVPGHMKDEPVILGGVFQKSTYGEFQAEMDLFNRAFAEVLLDGDMQGRPFTFPIPTYNITKDFDWDNPVLDPLWEVTAKYGIPYFSNFINSDMHPEDARSMCCRLRIDNRELRSRGGGLFGSNPLTGCYSDDTEIMTEKGWVLFKDLTTDDAIYTRTASGDIELHKPKNLFKYDWDGEMYRFGGRSIDLLVTPNHRMLCVDKTQTNKPAGQKFVFAEDFKTNTHVIPKTGNWACDDVGFFCLPETRNSWVSGEHGAKLTKTWPSFNINMDDWLAFLGIFISEGSYDNEKIASSHGYRTFISQTKKERVGKIKHLLDVLPFKYAEIDGGFVICNKQLWSYVKNLGHAPDKYIPLDLKTLPKERLAVLLDWLVVGDGHVRKNTGQVTYYTASKQLADDVQEIALKVGRHASIQKRAPRALCIDGRLQVSRPKTQYVVYINKSKTHRLRNRNISKEHYTGKVYCCEVENNTVLVRRNGKMSWCGNSIGVVTLNLPRLGYLAVDKEDFFDRLGRLMDLAKDALIVKRKTLEGMTENGLYPYSRFYLAQIKEATGGYWKNHFSTIGLIGMNEALLNLMGCTIADPEGQAFALSVLDWMRDRMGDYQDETHEIFNLEATPAEGASYRLAVRDREQFPDLRIYNQETHGGALPYYTNSTQLPVGLTDDLYDALRKQDELQTKYTGGTVFHVFLGERLPSTASVKQLVRRIAESFRLPYYTITPTFSICPAHGYLSGEQPTCPTCGAKSEVYSRIVGYLRPVEQWNDGKQAEFADRKVYGVRNTAH